MADGANGRFDGFYLINWYFINTNNCSHDDTLMDAQRHLDDQQNLWGHKYLYLVCEWPSWDALH